MCGINFTLVQPSSTLYTQMGEEIHCCAMRYCLHWLKKNPLVRVVIDNGLVILHSPFTPFYRIWTANWSIKYQCTVNLQIEIIGEGKKKNPFIDKLNIWAIFIAAVCTRNSDIRAKDDARIALIHFIQLILFRITCSRLQHLHMYNTSSIPSLLQP